MTEQASSLLNAPDLRAPTGLRDQAILALLSASGCAVQSCFASTSKTCNSVKAAGCCPTWQGRGTGPDVMVPARVKTRIDAWLIASGIDRDHLFRAVSKAGELAGTEIRDEKAVWRLVLRYAKASDLGKLAPHDLRRTCAKLRRKAGGDPEQIQLLLGHASIQTTEHYLGTEQALAHAVYGLEAGKCAKPKIYE